ncbi:MAG: potassium channel family protein [Fimbriimonadales bacterium]
MRFAGQETRFIGAWNWLFLGLSYGCVALFLFWEPRSAAQSHISVGVGILLWLLPVSRCGEIFTAFLEDALDQLSGDRPRTTFTPPQRLGLALRSYLEVIANFAIIFFLLPASWFVRTGSSGLRPFRTAIDALYFSGTTITTLGYGDITPVHPVAQLLTLYEVLGGIALAVLTIGTYIGQVGRSSQPSPK